MQVSCSQSFTQLSQHASILCLLTLRVLCVSCCSGRRLPVKPLCLLCPATARTLSWRRWHARKVSGAYRSLTTERSASC